LIVDAVVDINIKPIVEMEGIEPSSDKKFIKFLQACPD